MADTQQQIISALKERFPAPWFERHAVVDEERGWFSAFVWISRMDDEYFKISRNSLDELLAAVRDIPLPAPPAQHAGEDDKHRERMADFGQYMFDAIHAMCDPIEEAGPLLDSPLHQVTDAYITAWKKIKRENESLQARLDAADKLAEAVEHCFFGYASHEEPEDMAELKSALAAYRAGTVTCQTILLTCHSWKNVSVYCQQTELSSLASLLSLSTTDFGTGYFVCYN